jgi:hypothetical protein
MRRIAGTCLVVASVTFWLSWVLMPGVGITDTAAIFALVGANRSSVFASVVLQLVSAAAFAPGLVAIATSGAARESRAMRAGCVLLAIGAMGSAADAVFHLVAYEMTDPAVMFEAMAPVMRRLQGPDLGLLLPFVVAFFSGSAVLAVAQRKGGTLGRVGFLALIAAPALLLVGVPMVRLGILVGRVVGLALLGAIAGSLATMGLSNATEAEPG